MEMIGFVGLGRMGRPMASNLCRKGFRLAVHDINRDAVAELELLQAQGVASVAAVARDSRDHRHHAAEFRHGHQIVAGLDGILAQCQARHADHGHEHRQPGDHGCARQESEREGHGFVDAPVGRLAAHADRGESLFMVGAAPEDFARVKPLLEAMGNTIYHCGPVGTGTRTKLVNNFLAVTSCQMNAEALALSQRFGLDLERTLDVLYGTTAFNGQLKVDWPNKVLKGDVVPGFTIDLAHKDLSLIVDAANAAKVPMPIACRRARSVQRGARQRLWRPGFLGNGRCAMRRGRHREAAPEELIGLALAMSRDQRRRIDGQA